VTNDLTTYHLANSHANRCVACHVFMSCYEPKKEENALQFLEIFVAEDLCLFVLWDFSVVIPLPVDRQCRINYYNKNIIIIIIVIKRAQYATATTR
jgi:hypothetical protein